MVRSFSSSAGCSAKATLEMISERIKVSAFIIISPSSGDLLGEVCILCSLILRDAGGLVLGKKYENDKSSMGCRYSHVISL